MFHVPVCLHDIDGQLMLPIWHDAHTLTLTYLTLIHTHKVDEEYLLSYPHRAIISYCDDEFACHYLPSCVSQSNSSKLNENKTQPITLLFLNYPHHTTPVVASIPLAPLNETN